MNGKKSGLEPSKKKKAINIQKMFEKMVPGHEMKFKTEPEFEVSEPDSFGDATPKPDSPFKMSSLKVNALMQVNTKSNKDQKLKSNENSDTFGLGVKNLTEAQNNTSDTISNICDRNSDKENDHCHSDSGDIKVNNTTDLEDAEVWHEYHSRLRKAERAMEERRGWDGFNSVYMISAIDGDGVWDLKVKGLDSNILVNILHLLLLFYPGKLIFFRKNCLRWPNQVTGSSTRQLSQTSHLQN